MKRSVSIIYVLFITSLIICCSSKGNRVTEKMLSDSDFQSIPIDTLINVEKYQILTKQGFSLTGDSVDISISNNEIREYFETADTISAKIAISGLKSYTKKFSICGEMIYNGDTLDYFILADGTGITYRHSRIIIKERNVKFYRNSINMPSDDYKKQKSKLNILHFSKSLFDFDIWELWKNDDEEGFYIDNNEQYKAYKRWNDQLDANGINRAFSLMKNAPTQSSFNVDWSFDQHCSLFGLAIMNDQLYTLYMNGGGVIFLSQADNDYEGLYYGCYEPDCLKYFTYFLQK